MLDAVEVPLEKYEARADEGGLMEAEDKVTGRCLGCSAPRSPSLSLFFSSHPTLPYSSSVSSYDLTHVPSVHPRVYMTYSRASGSALYIVLIFLLFALAQVGRIIAGTLRRVCPLPHLTLAQTCGSRGGSRARTATRCAAATSTPPPGPASSSALRCSSSCAMCSSPHGRSRRRARCTTRSSRCVCAALRSCVR